MMCRARRLGLAAALLLLFGGSTGAGEAGGGDEYLARVRAYADCMIDHGQDTYGAVHSPSFAEALDRKTLKLLEGDALKRAAGIKREEWGIRSHDRMLGGGNPQHCENLYQVLYALGDITADKKYTAVADQSLEWFLTHCQSEETGLFWWGEHAGWDFLTEKPLEKPAGNTHEMYRPWVLWERSWKLSPEACRKFAVGLWEHQIADHETGDFSRHAAIDRHGPGHDAPYARHGGCYIRIWATAYQHTKDPVFLKAIEVVLGGLDRDRLHGGMVTGGSRKRGGRTAYDLPVAIAAWEAAELVPEELAGKLRSFAAANDKAFCKAAEARAGAGGVARKSDENLWSSGYGLGGGELATMADLCVVRWRQVKLDAYRQCALEVADKYGEGAINVSFPVYPGTVGKVITLLVAVHEMTGEGKYLDRAEELAGRAEDLFLTDGCPLPKATHVHEHYEAVTGADTLMMAMLELWAARQKPPVKVTLEFTDR